MADEVKNPAETNPADDHEGVVEQATQPEGSEGKEESGSQDAPEQKPQPQSKEENAKYAAARRERERKESRDEGKHEGVVETIIKYVKVNPYTQKPIETAEDVERYLMQEQLERAGKDPNLDYAQALDEKAKKIKDEEQKEIQAKKQMDDDIAAFRKANPDVDLKGLFENPNFARFCGESIGKVPLTTLYDNFQEFVASVREEEKTKLVTEAAQGKSGVGSAKNSGQPKVYSKSDIMKMSYDERAKLYASDPQAYKKIFHG